MGFINSVRTRYRMSQAAVAVQNLLEPHAKIGMLERDPALLANRLVADIWAENPDVFEGKFGQRPHKIAVAAIALANGVRIFSDDLALRNTFVIALGEIIKELNANAGLHLFNSLDHDLLNRAIDEFSAEATRLENSPIFSPTAFARKTPKWEIIRVADWVQFTHNISGRPDESQETWTFVHPKTGESVQVKSTSGDAPFLIECPRTNSRHIAESVDRAVFLVGETLGTQDHEA
jgi:hypothetical protein